MLGAELTFSIGTCHLLHTLCMASYRWMFPSGRYHERHEQHDSEVFRHRHIWLVNGRKDEPKLSSQCKVA